MNTDNSTNPQIRLDIVVCLSEMFF